MNSLERGDGIPIGHDLPSPQAMVMRAGERVSMEPPRHDVREGPEKWAYRREQIPKRERTRRRDDAMEH